MGSLTTVCVFCGSSAGADGIYAEAAEGLGRAIARSGRTLVYGGGNIGLMGVLADAALAEGGTVVGVIPQALVAREKAHAGLTELVVVESMHERKAAMADRADAFVATAGGLGTLEELFEAWTWGQLGLHAKPLGLLDLAEGNGFFSPLLTFLDRLVDQRFVRREHREMLIVDPDPGRLLERLERYGSSPSSLVHADSRLRGSLRLVLEAPSGGQRGGRTGCAGASSQRSRSSWLCVRERRGPRWRRSAASSG